MVADELEGDFGADFWDRVNVVAAEEDAEVDELFPNVSIGSPLTF